MGQLDPAVPDMLFLVQALDARNATVGTFPMMLGSPNAYQSTACFPSSHGALDSAFSDGSQTPPGQSMRIIWTAPAISNQTEDILLNFYYQIATVDQRGKMIRYNPQKTELVRVTAGSANLFV